MLKRDVLFRCVVFVLCAGFVCAAATALPGGVRAEAMSDEKFAAMCWSGRPREIRGALKKGANPNARDKDGTPALYWAAVVNDHPEATRALLEAGADVNATTKRDGETALMGAAYKDESGLEKVRLLLGAGADVNARDQRGRTALMRAAEHDGDKKERLGMVRALLAAGADVNARDQQGRTALMRAAEHAGNKKERLGLVRALLAAGADVNAQAEDGASALSEAYVPFSGEADHEIFRALLAAGADVDRRNPNGRTALMRAASRGLFPAVRALLEAGADKTLTDKDGHDALWHARHPANAEPGRFEGWVWVMRLLQGHGEGLPAMSDREFVVLCREGSAEEVRQALKEHGANPNALALAAAVDNRDGEAVVRALLAAGADPKAEVSGETVLLRAVKSGRALAALALLTAGANPNAKDREGETALIHAVSRRDPALVQALLAAGAKPDAKDRHGQTELLLALGGERADADKLTAVVRALLAAGADPNAKDADGVVALRSAVSLHNLPAVVQALLAAGADVFGDCPEDSAACCTPLELEELGRCPEDDAGCCTPPLEVEASYDCEAATIRALLEAGAGRRGKALDRALLRAAQKNAPEAAALLLRAGADPNAKDEIATGETALARAAWFGNRRIVAMLLRAGADVNAAESSGRTALMAAASRGELETVRALLKAGANVNAADSSGWTALMAAADRGELETVRALLAAGANVNAAESSGWTALPAAAAQGELETVRALLAAGADVNAQAAVGVSALSVAYGLPANEGGREVVRALLDAGADIDRRNPDGRTALMGAASWGDFRAVRAMLEAGADRTLTDKDGHDALWHARHPADAKPGRFEGWVWVMRLLQGHGEGLPAMSNREFIVLCRKGSAEEVRQALKEHGANPEAEYRGDTPLMTAAARRDDDRDGTVVRALLEAGADPNICFQYPGLRKGDDCTALAVAARQGHIEAIRLLLAAGADVNVQNEHGGSALSAAYEGASGEPDREVLRVLSAAGADMNRRDPDGRTPLMSSAAFREFHAVRAMLRAGADKTLKDDWNRDALSYSWTPEWRRYLQPLGPRVPREGSVRLLRLLRGSGEGLPAMPDWEFVGLCGEGAAEEVRQALRELRANPNAKEADGRTVLMSAASRRDLPVVRALLAAGANVNALDKTGATALICAVAGGPAPGREASGDGEASVVRALLEAGADPNVPDVDGVTALMYAASRRDPSAVRALLAADADRTRKDAEGHDALWRARQLPENDEEGKARKAELIRLLENAGKKKP